jgi:hypothetical protein
MMELQPGDGVCMKAFKWHSPDGFAVLSYAGPKKKDAFHLFMWLGVFSSSSSDATADERLNALGWVFDPERAKTILATKESTP